MKNFKLMLGAFLTLLIISCEGPEGPPGINGSEFEAPAFEITRDLVFNANNGTYELTPQLYPSDINPFIDDVILIYRLEDVVDDNTPVWRQLPQPLITDQGTLFYNFDFTLNDFNIVVESDFDPNLVPLDLVEDQTFRIVVIPANLGSSKLDTSNIEAVLSALNINEADIKKVK